MSVWLSLGCVPKDGRKVMFWAARSQVSPLEEGSIIIGTYDSVLDYYMAEDGSEIYPFGWRELPRGPAHAGDIIEDNAEGLRAWQMVAKRFNLSSASRAPSGRDENQEEGR